MRRLGERNSLRFFAPPVLVVALGASAVAAPLLATGALTGAAAAVGATLCAAPVAYGAFLVYAGASEPGGALDRLRFVEALAIMHVSWGAGFLRGATRGARDSVDTSRTQVFGAGPRGARQPSQPSA